MRELAFFGKRKLGFRDVPEVEMLSDTDVVVRPFAVARCDLETAFFRHGLSPLLRAGVQLHLLSPQLLKDFGSHPFSGPMPVGHEGVAQVLKVGSGVKQHRVGDVCVIPYQVSCGQCPLCSLGKTAHCETDRPSPISAFGGFADPEGAWGGFISDELRVPFADHMLVPFPKELDPVSYASASDNIVDGYRAVADGLETFREAPVLVAGGRARSVGLYAVACAKALGSSEVTYVDTSRERLEIAEKLGATVVEEKASRLRRSGKFARRFLISVEASGRRDGLMMALEALRACGKCEVVAFHWSRLSKLPLWDMYSRNLEVRTGMAHARSLLPPVLELAQTGKLHVEPIVTQVASWSDAPEALLEPSTKVVVAREPFSRVALGGFL